MSPQMTPQQYQQLLITTLGRRTWIEPSKVVRRMSKKRKYVTASIPIGIANDIDKLIEEIGYWPSKGSFVREACTEKIWKERRRILELARPTSTCLH